jgi:hypothetical protein
MLKSYLTVALRNLVRDRTHSFIHITGLAIGMAIAMLIGLWVPDDEWGGLGECEYAVAAGRGVADGVWREFQAGGGGVVDAGACAGV